MSHKTIYPVITLLLSATILAVFVSMHQASGNTEFSTRMLYDYGSSYPPAVMRGQLYRLITAKFVHLDLWHLLQNLTMLLIAGVSLEKLIKRSELLLIIFFSAVISTIFSFILAPTVSSSGISGVIFGLFAALLVASLFDSNLNTRTRVGNVVAAILLIVVGDINVFSHGFESVEPLRLSIREVSSTGHLGGFIGGLTASIAILIIAKKPSFAEKRKKIFAGLIVLGFVLLSAMLTYASFYPQYHVPLAELNAMRSDLAESSIVRISRLKERFPDYYAYYGVLGAYYLDMEEYDLAYPEIDRAYELEPGNPFVHFVKINSEFFRDNYAQVCELGQSFIEKYPQNQQLVLAPMFLSAIDQKRFDAAAKWYGLLSDQVMSKKLLESLADTSDEEVKAFSASLSKS